MNFLKKVRCGVGGGGQTTKTFFTYKNVIYNGILTIQTWAFVNNTLHINLKRVSHLKTIWLWCGGHRVCPLFWFRQPPQMSLGSSNLNDIYGSRQNQTKVTPSVSPENLGTAETLTNSQTCMQRPLLHVLVMSHIIGGYLITSTVDCWIVVIRPPDWICFKDHWH